MESRRGDRAEAQANKQDTAVAEDLPRQAPAAAAAPAAPPQLGPAELLFWLAGAKRHFLCIPQECCTVWAPPIEHQLNCVAVRCSGGRSPCLRGPDRSAHSLPRGAQRAGSEGCCSRVLSC